MPCSIKGYAMILLALLQKKNAPKGEKKIKKN